MTITIACNFETRRQKANVFQSGGGEILGEARDWLACRILLGLWIFSMLKINESMDSDSAIAVWARQSPSLLPITTENSDKNVGRINYLRSAKAKTLMDWRGVGWEVFFCFSFLIQLYPEGRSQFQNGVCYKQLKFQSKYVFLARGTRHVNPVRQSEWE